jgi:hypothetical protein
MSDADSRWADFEQLGERQVRQYLALRVYGEDNVKLAKAWLEYKESLSSAATQAESLALAKAAQSDASRAAAAAERAAVATEEASIAAKRQAEAADRQARAAESANKRATIAIAISVASIIITIIIAIAGFRFAGAR